MTAPQVIHISETEAMDLHDWCLQQSEYFTALHSKVPLFYSVQSILDLIAHCNGDGVLENPLIEEELEVAKQIAQLLTKSAEIEASKHEQEARHDFRPVEEPGLIPEPEETVEPVGVEAPTEPVEAQGATWVDYTQTGKIGPLIAPASKISEAYDLALANQKAGKEAMRGRLTVLSPNSQEISIVDAAKNANKGSYLELKEFFDFGENLESVTAKPGLPVTPAMWGSVLGFGIQWGHASGWIISDAVAHLEVLGFSGAVEQIAADFKLAKSTVYNHRRTAQRIPADSEARKVLDITTCTEIACARYDKDEVKQQEAVEELLKEAVEGQWDAATARSHSKAKRGHNEEINDGNRQTLSIKFKEAKDVLQKLLDRYLAQAREDQSWDATVNREDEVIAARRVLGIVQP